ncbi:MAG: hypothetical protein P9M08_02070 [Candidatus Erginobacter occultus]|nr:hypothetical protein [Candidatus Erginobacter occultus]
MVYTHELAREGEGEYRFRDFFRDERAMAGIFENFVRNFYQEELRKADPAAEIVGVEWIEWEGEALTRNQDYDKERINSANLYQIFSYVRNLAQRSSEYEHCEGMLLYPTVETDLRLQYTLHGHRITVCTISTWPRTGGRSTKSS